MTDDYEETQRREAERRFYVWAQRMAEHEAGGRVPPGVIHPGPHQALSDLVTDMHSNARAALHVWLQRAERS